MKTSEQGKEMIKKFEGLVLNNYRDVGGNFTIGYGHLTNDPHYASITKERAEYLFEKDIEICEKAVNKYHIIYEFNQNQYDALISFTFNCGVGNLNKLTANGQRPIKVISEKIIEYNKCNGTIVKGLVTRRTKEKMLFDTPVKLLKPKIKECKIALNISKRTPVQKVIETNLLDFSNFSFVLAEFYYIYGTGNIDKNDNENYELCLLENVETGTVEMCYIPCSLIKVG